ARSGMCGEDCKWCAQATRHHTGCATYNFIDADEVMHHAHRNESEGISRFSLVTSGRAVSKRDLTKFCDIYRRLSEETDLCLCASMGLLDDEAMQMLADAGVRRYHCNMETCEEHFTTLCTTHTPADKRATIAAARRAGMEVCSGGIIGMGETMEQRVDFAMQLRDLNVDSVPINILNPIPGTPLEDTPLISEEDIIRTAAMFRFVLPRQSIRFAGGRMRLSDASMARMLRGGVNGVLMGDMLTPVSNQIADDRRLFARTGWLF
ncbi:MAG: biotin synthase BioB, partial [Muribaculaceae bacterium]|nr:biotin synthase BioB [Muribaculaceae bacterium]